MLGRRGLGRSQEKQIALKYWLACRNETFLLLLLPFASFTGVNRPASLACAEIEFRFTGRAAHAAAVPHLGRSALDAVELMNVGINYMREHMPSTARIHYAVTNTGGIAPNVVQAYAEVRHLVRARTLGDEDRAFGKKGK